MIVEEWDTHHPYFPALIDFIQSQGQTDWVTFTADWHRSSHLLVARRGDTLVGFLRFVVQPIGPDADCPPVQFQGDELLEAKVLAFAVDKPCQGKGIGRQLQEALIPRAQALGCYQIRSHSGGDHPANHHLKLSLGYTLHPIVRGDDRLGAYFILPLRRDKKPGPSDKPGGGDR
ncbi:MAG TPA: GNAT family N-acetyltransferase [Anaerolineales bacterium]|nr:GNAT family N-acetyltransferase [Anaerolineales bacterium]